MSENGREGSFIKTLMTIVGVLACLAALAAVVTVFVKEYKKKICTIAEADSQDGENECESSEECTEEPEEGTVEVDCEFAE